MYKLLSFASRYPCSGAFKHSLGSYTQMVILSSMRKNRTELHHFANCFSYIYPFPPGSSPRYTNNTHPGSSCVQAVCELSAFLAVPTGPGRDWFLLSHLPDPPGAFTHQLLLRKEQGFEVQLDLNPSSALCDLWRFLGSVSLGFHSGMLGKTEPGLHQIGTT